MDSYRRMTSVVTTVVTTAKLMPPKMPALISLFFALLLSAFSSSDLAFCTDSSALVMLVSMLSTMYVWDSVKVASCECERS